VAAGGRIGKSRLEGTSSGRRRPNLQISASIFWLLQLLTLADAEEEDVHGHAPASTCTHGVHGGRHLPRLPSSSVPRSVKMEREARMQLGGSANPPAPLAAPAARRQLHSPPGRCSRSVQVATTADERVEGGGRKRAWGADRDHGRHPARSSNGADVTGGSGRG
jgi:hypothetical protein